MRLLYIITIVIVLACGCVSHSRLVYQQQIQRIEQAYQTGEITKAEYLNLKQNAENAYRQRKATIAAGVLSD